MLVKFECGCIGFPPRTPVAEGAEALLITRCDNDPYGYEEHPEEFYLGYRDFMGDKSYAPLSEEREREIVQDLQALLSDGYALRATRRRIRSVIAELREGDG
jgi:hypothetical protein